MTRSTGPNERISLRRRRLAVVHHQVGAGLPGQLGLLRAADRRDHPRAEELGQLDREVADRSGAAGHQDRLARDRAVGGQAAVRGHRGHAQAGPEFGRDAVRQRNRLLVRYDGPLRRRAPPAACRGHARPRPAAPIRPGVDAIAYRVDHAGAVVVRDLETVDRPRRRSAAGLPVGRVHAGVLDPTRTSPGPGSGRSTSSTRSTSLPVAVAVVERSSHDWSLAAVAAGRWLRVGYRAAAAGPDPMLSRSARRWTCGAPRAFWYLARWHTPGYPRPPGVCGAPAPRWSAGIEQTRPMTSAAAPVDPRDPRGLRSDAPLLDAWLRFTAEAQGRRAHPMAVPGHKQRQDLTGAVIAGDAPLYGGIDSIKHADVPRADAEARAAAAVGRRLVPVFGRRLDPWQPGAGAGGRSDRREIIVTRILHRSLLLGLVLVRPAPGLGPARGGSGVPGCRPRWPCRRCAPRWRAHPDACAVYLGEPSYVGTIGRPGRARRRRRTKLACRCSSTRPGRLTSAFIPICRRMRSPPVPTRW